MESICSLYELHALVYIQFYNFVIITDNVMSWNLNQLQIIRLLNPLKSKNGGNERYLQWR